MAFTPTLKDHVSALATTVAGVSFTPANGALLIAIVSSRLSGGAVPPTKPTITDTLSLTWTEIMDHIYDPGASPRERIVAWYTVIGTGAAVTLTGGCASAGASSPVALASMEFAGWGGVAPDFTNQIGADDANGDPSCVLPSVPAATSCVICHTIAAQANSMSKTASYTALGYNDAFASSSGRQAGEYDDSSAAQTVGWTSTNLHTAAIAFELKVASGGSTFNDSVSEAMSLAETYGNALTAVGAMSEALALADTVTTTGSFVHSVSEAIGLTDTVFGVGVFSKSISESVTLTDAMTGGLLSTGAVSEALALADTETVAKTLNESRAEALALADTELGALVAVGAMPESMSLVDAMTGVVPTATNKRAYAMIIG